MEKLLRPYDKEYMRMAMLKHEETFKEQVYELHRLYRIQKTLMRSIQNSHHGNMHQSSRTRLDLENPAEDHHHQYNINIAESEMIDESEIELTLGPARYVPRKKHGTPTSDSGPSSFSNSSSTESSHMNRTTKQNNMTLGYQNGSKNNIELEEQLRQERLKQPPWLFQVLSMNMT
ncbi:hypothetical protein COLO4_11544 [Corchorus olitorius]|uniref:Uncharacterized protein n=1 Tax=Corchorus olitorius TaxID=93759 RepID=A0A1R3K448_9ROSI|nr:hypothetical protein COLO4_11544 [Corchorus olitorius]